MAYSQSNNDLKNLQNIIEEAIKNSVFEYMNSMTTKDYLNNLKIQNDLKISDLKTRAELSGIEISISTLYKAFSYKKSNVCIDSLLKIAKLLNLNENDRKVLFISYYNDVFKSVYKEESDYEEISPNIEDKIKKFALNDLIIFLVKKYPNLTKQKLSKILQVSPKTIERHFTNLEIKNCGSRKKPKWIFKS